MFWSGWGKDREGMETGDAGWEGGDAAICVAPRRERRIAEMAVQVYSDISIHAPVKGATQSEIDKLPEVKFQSTLPRVLRTRP